MPQNIVQAGGRRRRGGGIAGLIGNALGMQSNMLFLNQQTEEMNKRAQNEASAKAAGDIVAHKKITENAQNAFINQQDWGHAIQNMPLPANHPLRSSFTGKDTSILENFPHIPVEEYTTDVKGDPVGTGRYIWQPHIRDIDFARVGGATVEAAKGAAQQKARGRFRQETSPVQEDVKRGTSPTVNQETVTPAPTQTTNGRVVNPNLNEIVSNIQSAGQNATQAPTVIPSAPTMGGGTPSPVTPSQPASTPRGQRVPFRARPANGFRMGGNR